MRSLFTFVPPHGDGHAYICAVNGGINLEPASDQLQSFPHAGDADTNFELGIVFPSLRAGRDSAAKVSNFQREIRVAINSYLGSPVS